MFQIKNKIKEKYGENIGNKIIKDSYIRFEEICKENIDEDKAMYSHTRKSIYPAISVFDSLLKNNIVRAEAIQFIIDFCEFRGKKNAKIVKRILKFPGMYKRFPKIFGNTAKKKFGVKQNFKTTFYEVSNKKVSFDMTKCPYNDIMKKYNCPEITVAFCRIDDVIYSDMHKKLKWHRTKTLGGGDECCNFNITCVK